MTDSDLDEKPSVPPDQYTIGWISALSEELGAARVMLDQEHEGLPDQPSNDDNSYVLGSIKQHNIVMPVLPDYGISSATSAVKSMQSTFPNLRFILMVGIGGGIPSKQHDIRLGDVAVSEPDGQGGGVIQYDLGREEKHQFLRVGYNEGS
ncbi:pfs domain-containing protein [Fusarium sp. MPI-SDFR-AT-0072]|nr:pfs domain-containing protein [Fusarium sp. MPI-SDFR-AT-0072]